MPIRLQLLLFGVLGNVLVAAIFIFSFDYRENIQEDSSNESLLTLYESAWYQTYNKSFDVMSKWLPVTGEMHLIGKKIQKFLRRSCAK